MNKWLSDWMNKALRKPEKDDTLRPLRPATYEGLDYDIIVSDAEWVVLRREDEFRLVKIIDSELEVL